MRLAPVCTYVCAQVLTDITRHGRTGRGGRQCKKCPFHRA